MPERRAASEEPSLVRWLRVHSYFAGLLVSFYLTGSLDLFVESFGEEMTLWLPLGYLASAALGFVVSDAYRHFERKWAFERLLNATVLFLLATVATLAVLTWFGLGSALLVAFVVYAWFRVVFFLRNVVFWSLAGFFLDLKQSKRLFGLISSGEALGALTGFAATFLLSFTSLGSPGALLGIAALVLALWSGWMRLTVRRFGHRFAQGRALRAAAQKGETEEVGFLDDRFMMLFGLLAVFPAAALYVDYVFLNAARETLGDVGRFIAVFYGLARLIELLVKTRLSAWVVRRWGVLVGLATLPAVLIVTGALALLSALFVGASAEVGVALVLLFVFGSLGRLADRVLRPSVYEPAFQVLFQALPAPQRVPFQSKVEGQARLSGVAVMGLALLALRLASPDAGVSWPLAVGGLVVVVSGWLVAVWAMRNAYQSRLGSLLAASASSAAQAEPSFRSAETLDVLEKRIRRAGERRAVNALNALEVLEPRLALRLIVDMLGHESPILRRRAAEGAADLRATSLLPVVEKLATSDADEAVRSGAAAALAVLRRAREDLESERRLEELARSQETEDRIHVARIAAHPEAPAMPGTVRLLLLDRERRVRMAAMAAAGQERYSSEWPALIRGLEAPLVAYSATSALVAAGSGVLTELEAHARRTSDRPRVLERLLRVCEHMGDTRALDLAWQQGRHASGLVRERVIHTLGRARFTPRADQLPTVRQWLRETFASASRLVAALMDLGDGKETAPVAASLRRELDERRLRLLSLLQILCDTGAVELVRERLTEGNDEGERAFALELLDQLVEQDQKPLVHALVEEMPLTSRFRRLDARFPQERMTPARRLRDVINRGSSAYDGWTKTRALQALAVLEPGVRHPELLSHLFNPDPVLMQVSALALRAADPEGWPGYLASLPEEARARIDDAVRGLAREPNGDLRHFTERVTFLKGLGEFSSVPETSLLLLAPELRLEASEEGAVVFAEGEPSRDVVIVAEGELTILRGSERLTSIDRPAVLGELDVLLGRPRAISYRAARRTRFFRVPGATYLDLLSAHLPATGGAVASFDEV